jgi:uncharacterized protein YciI/N-acetylglutamate synthase-like GNAT family acetyltransferase
MPQFLYRIQPARPAMLTEGPTPEEARLVGEHFAYLQGLAARGTLLLAGRTTGSGAATFGIAIYEAPGENEARAIMQADPAIRDGVFRAELFPYSVAVWSPHGPLDFVTETTVGGLRVTTDPRAIDVDLVHRFLSEQSAWAKGIPLETVRKALAHSLCFSGFVANEQVAFARVITDRATFANLVDVFVLPDHRGRGHAKALVQAVLAHPDLQGLRRFTLHTADAHGLYAQFGFTAPVNPATAMERFRPGMDEGQGGDA